MEEYRQRLSEIRLAVGTLFLITALCFVAGFGCVRVDEEGRPLTDDGYYEAPVNPEVPEADYLDSWNVGEGAEVRTYVHRYEYEGDTFLVFTTRNREGDALSTAVVEVR
jgi:hypothetical protein